MRGKSPKVIPVLGALVLAFAVAACGGGDGDGDGGATQAEKAPASDVTIIHGTTDQPQSFDPAGSYDLPSWSIIYNVMEGLLTLPPGSNEPEPQLAESCDFDDPKTYTCTLKQGVTFHDGSPFTAEDVKFSFDRNLAIEDPEGASTLFASLKEVEVVDDQTVTFHLKQPDATWPFLLTVGSAAIVPNETYSADKIQGNGPGKVVGTGPYELVEYRPGERTVLEAFGDFHGDAPANERVIVQYFDKSSALKLALEQGEVDIAYRSLTPTELDSLRESDGVEVVEGEGGEIRYLVFNVKSEPFSEAAVRRAMAYAFDRQSIVDNVYNGTVEPLYSMVPAGLEGHIDAFADEYGESPDVDAARQELTGAGVSTPVDVEIWWTPTHYGDLSADEYAEIKRSLEETDLFRVTLKSTEWDQYTEAAFGGQYPSYQLGWFPDFVDADNYLSPFYATENFLGNNYSNKQVDALISKEKASTNPDERAQAFEEIQRIAAKDVPIIPYWQGKQIGAIRSGVTGVEDTFDPSFIFRYWMLGKSE